MAEIDEAGVKNLLDQRNNAGGTAGGSTDDADGHIDRLAKKYLGVDCYPAHQAGEQRITYSVQPALVRHQKQG